MDKGKYPSEAHLEAYSGKRISPLIVPGGPRRVNQRDCRRRLREMTPKSRSERLRISRRQEGPLASGPGVSKAFRRP